MIPNLPTDNLYKFLALSGVLLFCFGQYFVHSQISDLEEKSNKMQLSSVELEIKLEWLIDEINTLQEIQDNTIAEQKGELKDEPSKMLITYSIQEYKALSETLNDKRLESKLETARLKHSAKYVAKLLDSVTRYNNILWVWSAVSLMLAIYGFTMWYLKVQKPLDKSFLQESEICTNPKRKRN
ncbi:hypothetical protein A0H77_13355 [Vibrio alginolyticus]|uniref:hypothetical protein n=1 Tax=Vibrio TaxID=662 RepID=UPI0007984B8F|nr:MULTISPECIES: hypothetical protein [Vibrio]KXZ36279.1 hypothetical protein A0H77_13355 [Vibrio alginolyticus]MDW1999883.1 hypothetical protein [Vibrio sp. 2304]